MPRGGNGCRAAHAGHFAQRATDIQAVWDSPANGEAYAWFTVEQANLRTAFRWAATITSSTTAAAIATYTAFVGYMVSNFEPIAWSEELLEPAFAVADHPSLAFLYVLAVVVLQERTDRACRSLRRRRRRDTRQRPQRGAVRRSTAFLPVPT